MIILLGWLGFLFGYVVLALITARLVYHNIINLVVGTPDIMDALIAGLLWPLILPLGGLFLGFQWFITRPTKAEKRKAANAATDAIVQAIEKELTEKYPGLTKPEE